MKEGLREEESGYRKEGSENREKWLWREKKFRTNLVSEIRE
jgi:hypothetical protein